MATQGGLCGQWLPLPLLVSCPRVIAFLVSPTLYISLSAPTLPLLPPLPHPPIPWSPLPVRVPGEAGVGEGVKGGGLRVGNCAMSPFRFEGGGAGLITTFIP